MGVQLMMAGGPTAGSFQSPDQWGVICGDIHFMALAVYFQEFQSPDQWGVICGLSLCIVATCPPGFNPLTNGELSVGTCRLILYPSQKGCFNPLTNGELSVGALWT